MSTRLIRVFSGSCLSLDDGDHQLPVLVERPHVLGSGVDMYDTERGIFMPPRPNKINPPWSGSNLDLNEAGATPSAVNSAENSPSMPFPSEPQTGSHEQDQSMPASHVVGNDRTQVLVIGAGGYLGGHIVNQLLHAGYTVRATLSDTNDRALVENLYHANHDTSGRLAIVQTDIFNIQSLRAAVSGCQTVIHCGVGATKVTSDGNSDILSIHMSAVQTFFMALTGGRPATKRVILTGSYVSAMDPSEGLVNDTTWNPTPREVDPLAHARVEFEKEAWRLSKHCGIDLVVMLPTILLGPCRTNTVSEAMAMIAQQANGSPFFPFAANLYWNFVDVRDAAQAYVHTINSSAAVGNRYLLATHCCNLAEIGRIIRKTHSHLSPPTMTLPSLLTLACGPFSGSNVTLGHLWRTLGVRREVDGSRAVRELGLSPIRFEETVNDAVNDLIAMGHAPKHVSNSDNQSSSVVRRLAFAAAAAAAVATVLSVVHRKQKQVK